MDRKQVKAQWDQVSQTYANSRDPDGPDVELITQLLDRFPEPPKVLDVGCGDGARTLKRLPESSVGLDIAKSGLTLAAENLSDPELIQGDIVQLPFADDSFDAITAYHVVFHTDREQHLEVYREFTRVLRPGGTLLMTLPSQRFDVTRQGWMGGTMYFSSPGRSETLSRLESAGFSTLDTVMSDDPLGSSAEFVFATV